MEVIGRAKSNCQQPNIRCPLCNLLQEKPSNNDKRNEPYA